jgi:DNA ligase-1
MGQIWADRELDTIYWLKRVPHANLESLPDIETYEEEMVKQGYEGICLRYPGGMYKFGRSTFREHYLLKMKRFVEAEAKVIGYEELVVNNSPIKIDRLGHQRRHTFKSGQIPGGVLGALIVSDGHCEFNIGSGFTDAERVDLWEKRDTLTGWLVKYKHQPHGRKIKPRTPIFLGLRSPVDMPVDDTKIPDVF